MPTPQAAAATNIAEQYLADWKAGDFEAMWGMLQTGISTLEFDFRGYAATYFDRLRQGFADPRVDNWLSVLTH